MTILKYAVVAITCLALGFAMGIRFHKARLIAVGTHCSNNLSFLNAAKDQVAQSLGLTDSATVTAEQIAQYCYESQVLSCPGGGTYSTNPIGVDATCSMRSDSPFHR